MLYTQKTVNGKHNDIIVLCSSVGKSLKVKIFLLVTKCANQNLIATATGLRSPVLCTNNATYHL